MKTHAKVRLRLEGLNGNAFALLGAFQRAAYRQGWPKAEVDRVFHEACQRDYQHLLATLLANTIDPDDVEGGEL